MSDLEDSTVTYTEISSPYEDLSDVGSPGDDGPIFQDPPSLDYVPGPEEPEQAPPSPIYIPFVLEPVYPEFLPVDDEVFPAEEQPMPAADSPTHQSPGYILESDPKEDPEEDDKEDPEEDPTDYPADRGDDRDDEESSDDDDDDDDDAEEEDHLAPAAAPAPFLSEEVAERLLALPTPPPSPLSPYSSPLPQIPSPPLPIPSPPPNSPTYVEGSLGSRAARIRQRDALPSPVHETEMPEIYYPASVRPRPRADLYGFADMLDAAPGRQTSRELGYGIGHSIDALSCPYDEEAGQSISCPGHSRWNELHQVRSEGISLRTTVMAQQSEIAELQAADRRRQTMISDLLKAERPDTRHYQSYQGGQSSPNWVMTVDTVQSVQHVMHQKGDDSITSERARSPVQVVPLSWKAPTRLLKCQPLNFKGTEGVVGLTQWFEKMESVYSISNCTVACQDAMSFRHERMDKKINTWAERQADNKRKSDDTARNNQNQQPNKRQNTRRAYAAGNAHLQEGLLQLKKTITTGVIRQECQGSAKVYAWQSPTHPQGQTRTTMSSRDVTILSKYHPTKDEDKSKEKRLEDVPVVQEFPEVFPKDLPGIPPTRQVEFRIDLVPGATPVAGHHIDLAPFRYEGTAEQTQELTDKGVKDQCPYPGTPVLFVKKKDGSVQMCIDYRN
ncbi:hypothetical protein Tco_0547946 [Tanacetum coccineum]